MTDSAKAHIQSLIERYPVLSSCKESIDAAAEAIATCFRQGGRLLICGNGGSAADSIHIVGELMKGFVLPRKLSENMQKAIRHTSPESADYLIANLQQALPAISLVSEIALSTAFANDSAPDLCFAQQVLGNGKKEDALLAISTSGNSANVVYAAQIAKAIGVEVISLTGAGGGKMADWSDILIAVPSKSTFQIQELHLPIYHALCLALEEEFFGGNT